MMFIEVVEGPTHRIGGALDGRRCGIVRAAPPRRRSVEDVARSLLDMGAELVVVAGREPLAQRVPLTRLTEMLVFYGARVAVETSGRLLPGDRLFEAVSHWSVRPLPHGIRPDVLAEFVDGAADVEFTFRAATPVGLLDVGAVIARCGIPAHRVWIETRPGSETAQLAAELGWNVSAGHTPAAA